MTDRAFEIAMRAFTRRRPFQPFLIELVSGTIHRITHPEAIRVRKGVARFIIAEDPERNFIFDSSSVCMVFDKEQPSESEG